MDIIIICNGEDSCQAMQIDIAEFNSFKLICNSTTSCQDVNIKLNITNDDDDEDDPKDFPDGEFLLLGDVLICPKVAKRQATQHSYETEISLLLIHGILHLLGYDHAEQEEREIMESRQKEILAKHGLKKNNATS